MRTIKENILDPNVKLKIINSNQAKVFIFEYAFSTLMEKFQYIIVSLIGFNNIGLGTG